MPFVNGGAYFTENRRTSFWYPMCSYCDTIDYSILSHSRLGCVALLEQNGWEVYKYYHSERVACPKCRPTCERNGGPGDV